MKLAFLGNGPFAVPALERLAADGKHPLLAVFTRPDRPQGRRMEIIPGPVRLAAERAGLPVRQPESVNDPETIAELADLGADLLVVADFGQILKPEAIAAARLGGINIHASLLPRHRGAAPVQWAVWHGDPESGVTIIRLARALDGGDMLAQARTSIGPRETAGDLEARLARLGAELAALEIDRLAAGTAVGRVQDAAGVTRAPKLSREHGVPDWRRAAIELDRQIRATQPWPVTAADWKRLTGQTARWQLLAATPIDPAPDDPRTPGTITSVSAAGIDVACGADGRDRLRIERIKPAGKSAMTVAELLRGNRVNPGESLVPESERANG
jgi:methionyl-tRNA formyltransferase